MKTVQVTLTDDQIELLCKGLDAYCYWELADDHYKRDGYVMEPGSDDEDMAAQIEAAEELQAALTGAQTLATGTDNDGQPSLFEGGER